MRRGTQKMLAGEWYAGLHPHLLEVQARQGRFQSVVFMETEETNGGTREEERHRRS